MVFSVPGFAPHGTVEWGLEHLIALAGRGVCPGSGPSGQDQDAAGVPSSQLGWGASGHAQQSCFSCAYEVWGHRAVNKRTQHVKVLASQPDNLSLMLGSSVMKSKIHGLWDTQPKNCREGDP